MTDANIHIATRFNGPPGSANGGYICGCLAEHTGAACVETRLMAPPPLATDLPLRRDQDELFALHGERPVARARRAELPPITVPAAPTLAEARAAEQHFVGFTEHAFPGCYVCGPQRQDGLRLFPGWLDDRRAVACAWTPGNELGDGHGRVALPQLYAALDCPGSFALARDPGNWVVLGSFTVQVDEAPRLGEDHVILGWAEGRDGRKLFAGTAVFDPRGRCLAKAHAVWVQIPAGSR
ncbi:hypothetical protein [Alloalcanivorax mobilis]|uniref:hypothetical protein n=1 Tax=Alloalcanivorax mobilis TaxID=2019569 RepID=UPI0012FFEB0E|nr:hypothetical protein [Alloalcanivorax mobilis]